MKIKGIQLVHYNCSYNELIMSEQKKRIQDIYLHDVLTEKGVKHLKYLLSKNNFEDRFKIIGLIIQLEKELQNKCD